MQETKQLVVPASACVKERSSVSELRELDEELRTLRAVLLVEERSLLCAYWMEDGGLSKLGAIISQPHTVTNDISQVRALWFIY